MKCLEAVSLGETEEKFRPTHFHSKHSLLAFHRSDNRNTYTCLHLRFPCYVL